MRLLTCLIALSVAATSLQAQDSSLRVLRHTPRDTASPGNIVSVTFDRPVAGRLDATVEASRLFRIEPAVAGRVLWRDPITIRFVPDEPLPPGAQFAVTIDTAFRAIDGSRLERPFRFTFHVPGPRLLAKSFDGDYSYSPGTLPLDGKVKLLYSAPIDLEALRRGMRLDLPGCGDGRHPLALLPVRQRPVADGDPYRFTVAGGWDRDTTVDRFRRVVELEPEAPLPENCSGHLVLPTTEDDARYGREESYAVRTAPSFRLQSFDCSLRGNCPMNNLTLSFTANVKREDVKRYVRLEPSVPLEIEEPAKESSRWVIRLRLAPRTTYTVIVDSAMRDVDGRALVAPWRARVTTGDFVPAIGYERGTLTVPRTGPRTIPLRHVNVRTVRVLSYHIPESRRASALSRIPSMLDTGLAGLADRPETTTVTLPGAFNVDTTTDLPLPASVAEVSSGLVAVRVEIASAIPLPEEGRVIPGRGARLSRVVTYAARYSDNHRASPQYALLQITDLAVNAKVGPDESTVLVTGLSDGRPKAGATVRKLDPEGKVIGQAKTDSSGVARLLTPTLQTDDGWRAGKPISNDWPPRAGLVEAVVGDDRVVTPLELRAIGYWRTNPLDPSWLGGYSDAVPSMSAAIFADRGIYRPGEMLYFKGVVRTGLLGALAVPASQPIRLTLSYRPNSWDDDEAVVVHDTVLTMTDFGTVADSVRLRSSLPLGEYMADLYMGGPGAWRSVASETVRVAEYRAPEFLVETHTDSTPKYGGDTVRVKAAARYLFGAPMGLASMNWSAVLHEVSPWELDIPGAEGWTVGEWDWWNRDDESPAEPTKLSGEDTLDAVGSAEIRVPIDSLRPSRFGRLTVSVAVIDVNRQVISSSVSVPVHPARLYVLARKQSRGWFWTVGRPAMMEIRTVRPDGTELPGVPVIVTVVRRDWSFRWSSGESRDSTVRTDTVRTSERPVSYSFVPTEGGVYDVKMSAADGRGSTARTTLSVYAIASGSGWRAQSPYHLPLVVGTRDVAVGDTAQVAFDSPFDTADAWVTIEREQVLEQRRMTVLRGANLLPVRIAGSYIPNVFVSVLLLPRGRRVVRPDSANQLIRVGYTELHVKIAPKRLAVAVAPSATEYRPGDTAVVRVRVRDAAGRGVRSEVTLWAVDQGVLALTGFQTPDVLARIYEPRALGSVLWSTLPTLLTARPDLIVELARGFSSTFGSALNEIVVTGLGTSTTGPSFRSKFRSTAFYLASAITDDDGRVELRGGVPDNLTTYRVMAVAIGADDRFGQGDTTLMVTRDLVARPSLPRFVRASDSLLAGTVVNARDGRARAVGVDVESEGIRLLRPTSRRITLAPGKGTEARFTFAMPPRDSASDSVAIRFRVTDGVLGDAVESRIPVQPDFHTRTHTLLGALRDDADVTLELPADVDAARSRLTMRVGTSPLAPMLAAYDWLRVYPYYCTEQIASAGRALIAVWRATRDHDPDALGGDPRPRLQQLADELSRRQRSDGGFRYWDDFEWTSPWLTTYAGLFLLEARDDGIVVDTMVLRRTARYLAASLKSPIDTGGMNRTERRSRRMALGNKVAAVDYLRRAGEPDVKAEDELLRLAPGMTWEDRLRLAEALAEREDARDAARALVDVAWLAVTPAGRRVDLPDSAYAERAFPSRVAPASRLLTASLALRPEQPLLGGLIETVLQQGRAEGRWAWSTQDYASVIMAMAALSGDDEPTRNVVVRAHGRSLLKQGVGATDSAAAVPLAGLLERGRDGRMRLSLHLELSSGAKPVYYSVSVAEVPSKPPVTPDIQGIVVERWYERFDNGRPVTSVKEGDLVRVRLRITVPADREFVAVEDPLPAGLEVVDLSLRTSGTLQPFVTPESERAQQQGDRDRDGPRWQSWLYGRWDDGWWSPWEHKALHDDKVVYFARMLWKGSYTASYIARATIAGTFVRPPAHAEEMYNPALQGRSDGGRFGVEEKAP